MIKEMEEVDIMTDSFNLCSRMDDAEGKCLSCGAPLPAGREGGGNLRHSLRPRRRRLCENVLRFLHGEAGRGSEKT